MATSSVSAKDGKGQVDAKNGRTLDPVTYEVLSHRIEEIIAEMYHTMARSSGNPVIFEAGDHQEGIFDAEGEAVMFGGGIVEWTYSLQAGVKHLVKEYEENPGIYDGDQFVLNHSYVAAVHAMDVQLLAPVFWEGKRVAWVVAAGHQLDVGGIDWGGMSPRAEEVYQEGIQIPGLKIVENNRVRKDVEETIRSMVRNSDLGMLDIYSKIATNNVAKVRVLEMIERYGLETVTTLFHQMRETSEAQVRARLRDVPNGTWEHAVYVESLRSEEKFLEVRAAVTKEGDDLTIDFTGTSPQSAGSQNISYVGTLSNAYCPYLTLVCHDILWTGGLYRPVRFVIPEGTIVNPTWPAAVSYNTPNGGGIMVIGAVHGALSKMLASNEKTRGEAYAAAGVGLHSPISSGINKDGNYFVFLPAEALASGMGGLAERDGFNTGANMWTPKSQISNVETSELLYPVLYLQRKEVPDTGGAGRHRGGVTPVITFIPWDAPAKGFFTRDNGHGAIPRIGAGLAGGYPAPNSPMGILRGSDIQERFSRGELPTDWPEVSGQWESGHTGGTSWLNDGDVVFAYQCGGGGFGDPLDRDPVLVLKDVIAGYVSASMAEDLYGVVVDVERSVVDPERTEECRKAILQERLLSGQQQSGPTVQSTGDCTSEGRMLDNLEVVRANGSAILRCFKCRYTLCASNDNYKHYALVRESPIARAQPAYLAPGDNPFLLREYFCPQCAAMFEVDMLQEGDEPLRNVLR